MSAKKAAKAVDYGTYTHEMLFKELDDTREQIERLTDKWAQIELEIIDRHTPNDEILEVGEVSKHFKGLVNE